MKNHIPELGHLEFRIQTLSLEASAHTELFQTLVNLFEVTKSCKIIYNLDSQSCEKKFLPFEHWLSVEMPSKSKLNTLVHFQGTTLRPNMNSQQNLYLENIWSFADALIINNDLPTKTALNSKVNSQLFSTINNDLLNELPILYLSNPKLDKSNIIKWLNEYSFHHHLSSINSISWTDLEYLFAQR